MNLSVVAAPLESREKDGSGVKTTTRLPSCVSKKEMLSRKGPTAVCHGHGLLTGAVAVKGIQ